MKWKKSIIIFRSFYKMLFLRTGFFAVMLNFKLKTLFDIPLEEDVKTFSFQSIILQSDYSFCKFFSICCKNSLMSNGFAIKSSAPFNWFTLACADIRTTGIFWELS